jgi:hypothetical protein
VAEGRLRHGLCRNGEYFDQIIWSILVDDWLARRMDIELPTLH